MHNLSTKLHENENNTDISICIYQICLPKLHKNILKYYGLDLFKEIAIGFHHGSQTTL